MLLATFCTDEVVVRRSLGQLVCAEIAGTAPLIANRTAIGLWETFDLINN